MLLGISTPPKIKKSPQIQKKPTFEICGMDDDFLDSIDVSALEAGKLYTVIFNSSILDLKSKK